MYQIFVYQYVICHSLTDQLNLVVISPFFISTSLKVSKTKFDSILHSMSFPYVSSRIKRLSLGNENILPILKKKKAAFLTTWCWLMIIFPRHYNTTDNIICWMNFTITVLAIWYLIHNKTISINIKYLYIKY